MRPGMRLGEALATCPELVLVEQDPAAAEQAWEEILRRLEDARLRGRAGRARLRLLRHARRRAALRRRRAGAEAGARRGRRRAGTRAPARPSGGSPRSPRRRSRGRARRWSSPTSGARDFLAPLPLTLLPLERRAVRGAGGARRADGSDSLPRFRAAPWPSGWGRTAGAPGAWRGERRTPASAPRRAPGEIVEVLEFPEAVGNELTLRRALAALARPVLAREERGGRADPRSSRSRPGSSAAARGAGR